MNSPSPFMGEGGTRARQRVGGRGPELERRAKEMRRNPTDAERRLWSILRAKRRASYKFKRQVIIDHYIVDFVTFRERLIVEADGSQHAENAYDERRDAYLKEQGFRLLHFWNKDILRNPNEVAAAILAALETPLSKPLSRKGREA